MDVIRIVSEIDAEITRLQKIRSALTSIGDKNFAPSAGKRGRPKGTKVVSQKVAPKSGAKKRKLSPEGRKRIADAMKRRWAAHRKEVQSK